MTADFSGTDEWKLRAPMDDELDAQLQLARLRKRLFEIEPEPVTLGRWKILERIGSGGMGVVYRAHDPELKREVAIKRLHPHLEGHARERLLREAQAMAKVSHRHVVNVYEVPTLDDQVCVVMEYIQGGNLKRWQAKERSLGELLDAYEQAAQGLAHLHGRGLVHRDFKPDNVLVRDNGEIAVSDLGLVHAVRDEATPATPDGAQDRGGRPLERTLTRDGARMGTPPYMAPEQLRGEPTDARSDQFSFCVALYEAVYGERPFAGETLEELEAAIMAGAPRPRGKKTPRWLHTLLARGLSADPDARFPDMEALLHALRRGRDRRRRMWTWLSVLAFVGMGALTLALVLTHRSTEDPCQGVERELDEIWNDEKREELRDRITASGPAGEDAWKHLESAFDDLSRRWRGLRTKACKKEPSIAEPLALDACLDDVKNLMNVYGHSLAAWDMSELPLDGLDKMARELTRLARDLDTNGPCGGAARPFPAPEQQKEHKKRAKELRKVLAQATTQEFKGSYKNAERMARYVVKEAASLGFGRLEAIARYRVGRILISLRKGDARDELERAAYLAASLHDYRLAADAWISCAKVSAEVLENPALARSALTGARLALISSNELTAETLVPGAEHDATPLLADYLEAYGLLAKLEEKHEDAADLHAAALAMREHIARQRAEDAPDLDVAKSLNNRANALSELGQVEEALALYQRALTIRKRRLDSNHALVSEILHNLGHELMNAQRYDEAREALTAALEIDRRVPGASSESLLRVLLVLGFLEVTIGQTEAADAVCDRIAQIHDTLDAQARSRPDRVNEHKLLALCYRAREDREKEIVQLTSVLNLLAPDLTAVGERGRLSLELAEVYRSLNQRAQACQRLADASLLLTARISSSEPDNLEDKLKIAHKRWDELGCAKSLAK